MGRRGRARQEHAAVEGVPAAPGAGRPGLVASGDGGYALDDRPSCVDALRVVGLAASAATARRSGTRRPPLDVGTEGLALFRGERAASTPATATGCTPTGCGWRRSGSACSRTMLAARVDLGAGGDVVGELEALVEQYPLREGLWSSLITALYRAGRQADALAAYTRVRRLLVDELGSSRARTCRHSSSQILRQSPALRRRQRHRRSRSRVGQPARALGTAGRAGGRPRRPAMLLRGAHRLVTLVGPAGVGKTRLAIEVARGCSPPGGVWLVRLDAADAAAVHRATWSPRRCTSPGGETALLDRLAGAETLLVFDNCEHVVDAVADLIGRLLDAAPQLRVLATSQLPLGLDGEHRLPARAAAASPTRSRCSPRRAAASCARQFALDADTAAVVEEVCRSLDGLPLAIELAAARISPSRYRRSPAGSTTASRCCGTRPAGAPNGAGRSPRRSRGATTCCSPMTNAACGPCPASPAARRSPRPSTSSARSACPQPSALDVVGRLVDRSLVNVEIAPTSGAVRYRLLDSIRAFASTACASPAGRRRAAAAHAAWFAETRRPLRGHRARPRPAGVLAIVRAERANIDAALAWCRGTRPAARRPHRERVRLDVGRPRRRRRRRRPGPRRARRGGPVSPAAGPGDGSARWPAGWRHQPETSTRAQADLDDALDDRRRSWPTTVCEPTPNATWRFLRIQQGRPPTCSSLASASLAGSPGRSDCPGRSAASRLLAGVRVDHARRHRQRRRVGERGGAPLDRRSATPGVWSTPKRCSAPSPRPSTASTTRASHLAARGRSVRAPRVPWPGRAAPRPRSAGSSNEPATHKGAIATLNRAIAATNSGDLRLAATARLHLARVLRSHRRRRQPRSLLEQNDRWYRSAGGGDGALLTRCLLAAVNARTASGGNADELHDILDQGRRAGEPEVQVYATDALARLASERGERAKAHELLRAADDIAAAAAHVVDSSDRVDADHVRGTYGAAPPSQTLPG